MSMDIAAAEAVFAEIRAGKTTALAAARALAEAGVRSYRVDFITSVMTLFGRDDDHHDISFPRMSTEPVAQAFSARGIEAALMSMRGPDAQHAAFPAKLMAAGCTQYVVYLNGRRAVYLGRDGDGHMIRMPGAQQ